MCWLACTRKTYIRWLSASAWRVHASFLHTLTEQCFMNAQQVLYTKTKNGQLQSTEIGHSMLGWWNIWCQRVQVRGAFTHPSTKCFQLYVLGTVKQGQNHKLQFPKKKCSALADLVALTRGTNDLSAWPVQTVISELKSAPIRRSKAIESNMNMEQNFQSHISTK